MQSTLKFKTAIILSTFLISTSFAAKLPRGCEVIGFGFKDNFLILNETGEQAFYLIQNNSTHQIELELPETKEAFMSPRLESKLDAGNWSAFASNIENLNFQCFNLENNTKTLVNCSEVLDVCQYPRAKFPLSNMGNYWISTNKSQSQVIKEVTAKGTFLHW